MKPSSIILAVALAVGAKALEVDPAPAEIRGYGGACIDSIQIPDVNYATFADALAVTDAITYPFGRINYNPQNENKEEPLFPITPNLDETICPLGLFEYIKRVQQYVKSGGDVTCNAFFGEAFRFTIANISSGSDRTCDITTSESIDTLVVKSDFSVGFPNQIVELQSTDSRAKQPNQPYVVTGVGTRNIVPNTPLPSPQPTPLREGPVKEAFSGVWGVAGSRGNGGSLVTGACIDQLMYTKGPNKPYNSLVTTGFFTCDDLPDPCSGSKTVYHWNKNKVPKEQQFCRKSELAFANSGGSRFPLTTDSCPFSFIQQEQSTYGFTGGFNRPTPNNDKVGSADDFLGGSYLDGAIGLTSDPQGNGAILSEYLSGIVQYGDSSVEGIGPQSFCGAGSYGGGLSFQLRDTLTGLETRVINIWGTRVDVSNELARFEVDCASGKQIVGFDLSNGDGKLFRVEYDVVRDGAGIYAPPNCTIPATASPTLGPTLGPVPSPSKGPTLDPSPVPVPQPTSIPAPAPSVAPSPSPTTTCTGVCTETKDAVDALKAQMDAQDVQIRKIKKKVNSVEKLVKQIKDAVVPATP